MTAPVPAPLKALRASLRRTTEAPLRDRLQAAIGRLEVLYDLPRTFPDDNGDMKRRKNFVGSRHSLRGRILDHGR